MPKRNRKAFTFIEVILTLIIMGILAAVVFPRFGGSGLIQTLKLRSASSQIASDIRYTRSLAIADSADCFIKFDFEQKEYRIYKDSINPQNQVGETKKIPTDISLSGIDQFDFYPLGNSFFRGEDLSLSLDTHQYKIKVEPPSGAVVIEKMS